MKRLYYESFITQDWGEKAYAVTVKDGEIYVNAWVEDWPDAGQYLPKEDTEPYRILSGGIKCERDLLATSSIFDAVTASDDYNKSLFYHYEANANRADYKSVYDRLCSFINPYVRNGDSDENDYDIFSVTEKEFQNIYDILRNGDYIFVFGDSVEE